MGKICNGQDRTAKIIAMAVNIPISFLFFLTTQGYHGVRGIYPATLQHLDRQIPLKNFNVLYAHIKITPGEEDIAALMRKDLEMRGFVVETATANWSRGMSHFHEYIKDQIKVSKDGRIYRNPFILWSDFDYPMLCHKDSLGRVLSRMTTLLIDNQDVLSFRFLREGDSTEPVTEPANEAHPDWFFSRDFNWQPLVMRSRDYFLACKMLEDNWQIVSQMHGEAAWREILKGFGRAENKHAVWVPEYAQVANLGCDQYSEVAKRLNLTIQ